MDFNQNVYIGQTLIDKENEIPGHVVSSTETAYKVIWHKWGWWHKDQMSSFVYRDREYDNIERIHDIWHGNWQGIWNAIHLQETQYVDRYSDFEYVLEELDDVYRIKVGFTGETSYAVPTLLWNLLTSIYETPDPLCFVQHFNIIVSENYDRQFVYVQVRSN